jgi:hypothetical protein
MQRTILACVEFIELEFSEKEGDGLPSWDDPSKEQSQYTVMVEE